ncbi:MAG: hypothetical protein ACI3XR_09575 [Eubacteriales bacterium]
MEENKKSNACCVIGKILMIIGLAAVVAAVVTLLCKKLCRKEKENRSLCEGDDEAVDDYDVCCYDSDDLEDCIDGESDDDADPAEEEEDEKEDESKDETVAD